MLSAGQISFYQDAGYLVTDDIFSTDELDDLEREFDGIIERRLAKKGQIQAIWDGNWQKKYPNQKPLVHTHDLQAYSAAWTRILVHTRFTEAISDLMGCPNVQLHHTKMFLKPTESGSGFPMHQDYHYFPHENDTMMAGVLHLTDSTDEMGCIRVVPTSHKLGPLEPYEHRYLDPKEYPIEAATACVAKRGDVLFFSYLTIHGSSPNRSDKLRKTVLFQVRDPSDSPLKDTHRSHAQGLIMRGVDPLAKRATAKGTLDDRS